MLAHGSCSFATRFILKVTIGHFHPMMPSFLPSGSCEYGSLGGSSREEASHMSLK